jgi:sulfite exporter TauE/SafE
VSLLIGIVLLGVFIKQKSFMHFHFPNSPYPFLKGVLLGALPCIWVSSFSVLLIGIANPFRGALLILVFWTGTLPGFWLQNWIQKQSWFSPKLQLPIQRVLIGLSLLFVIVRLASALPVGKNGTSNPLIHKEWFCLPGGSLILK